MIKIDYLTSIHSKNKMFGSIQIVFGLFKPELWF